MDQNAEERFSVKLYLFFQKFCPDRLVFFSQGHVVIHEYQYANHLENFYLISCWRPKLPTLFDLNFLALKLPSPLSFNQNLTCP